MPKHVFTIIARGHTIDAQNNTLSLFMVLEQIGPSSLPAALPELSVVTLWNQEPEDIGVNYTQRTSIVEPDGSELAHLDTSFIFDQQRQRVLSTVINLRFKQSGVHYFNVHLRPSDSDDWGELIISYPLEVSVTAIHADEQLTLQGDEASAGESTS